MGCKPHPARTLLSRLFRPKEPLHVCVFLSSMLFARSVQPLRLKVPVSWNCFIQELKNLRTHVSQRSVLLVVVISMELNVPLHKPIEEAKISFPTV